MKRNDNWLAVSQQVSIAASFVCMYGLYSKVKNINLARWRVSSEEDCMYSSDDG